MGSRVIQVIEDLIYPTEPGRRIGKSQSTIANKNRILRLETNIKKRLLESRLTERHARGTAEASR